MTHQIDAVHAACRHSTNDKSADIRVVRPTPDGGVVEVVVSIVPK